MEEILGNLYEQVETLFDSLYIKEEFSKKEDINIKICSNDISRERREGDVIVTGCHQLIELLFNKYTTNIEGIINGFLKTLTTITLLEKVTLIARRHSFVCIQINKNALIKPLIKGALSVKPHHTVRQKHDVKLIPYCDSTHLPVTMETGRLLMVTNLMSHLLNVPYSIPNEVIDKAPLFSSLLSGEREVKKVEKELVEKEIRGEREIQNEREECGDFLDKLLPLALERSHFSIKINVQELLNNSSLYGKKKFPSNLKCVIVKEKGTLTPVCKSAADINHTLSHDNKKLLLLTTQRLVSQAQQSMALLLAANNEQKLSLLEVGPAACVDSNSIEDYVKSVYSFVRGACETKYGPVQKGSGLEEISHTMGEAAVKFELLSTDPKNTLKLVLPGSDLSDTYFEGTFVLYNYARIATIENNFLTAVGKGTYPPLPSLDDIDYTLLNDQVEWELLYGYVLQYHLIVNESMELQGDIKVNSGLKKLCQFLIKLSHLFSQYYSRVKILLAPETKLFPLIHARLVMMLSIKQVLNNGLQLLGINPLEQL